MAKISNCPGRLWQAAAVEKNRWRDFEKSGSPNQDTKPNRKKALKNASFWTLGLTLSDLVADMIEDHLDPLKKKGKALPAQDDEPKKGPSAEVKAVKWRVILCPV